ncbi:MAG: type 1 glutamine amidotransferase [Bacteroidales bacterium]|nr:type 1 glutamine amidotransferase [Bacteroidales bacterium]
MRISIIQNEPFETPGALVKWLEDRGIFYLMYHCYRGDALPIDDNPDMVIVLGGTASVYDNDEQHAYLKRIKSYLSKEFGAGTKIVGICLGAQLLADLLGEKVYSGNEKEIGWYPVSFNQLELDELGYSNFPESQLVLHWHGDTFNVPSEATPIASSKLYPNQGFIYKNQLLALQFHMEATQTWLNNLLIGAENELNQKGNFVQSRDELIAGLVNIDANHKLLFNLLDTFLKS